MIIPLSSKKPQSNVSIHLLLEIALEEYNPISLVIGVPMFQSISYWKLLWKKEIGWETKAWCESFNPSLIGNCSGRMACSMCGKNSSRFNPSLIGNCSGRVLLFGVFLGSAACFNPSLIGNCSGRVSDRNHPAWDRGFNPSLIGNCSGSPLEIRDPATGKTSFNPSLIGNCSGSESIKSFGNAVVPFQSISYWKLLWKVLTNTTHDNYFVFQSISYWKLLWKDYWSELH